MSLNIQPFINLGKILENGIPEYITELAAAGNMWFTKENIRKAAAALSNGMLSEKYLVSIEEKYGGETIEGKNIGIIMAGNIPMVGFADLMAVLILRGKAHVKLSSKDSVLMEWIISVLSSEPGIEIQKLDDESPLDAIIATGSDNSNLVFRQKYGHLPAIFRGSRTSAAIIDKPLAPDEYDGLRRDIFDYYGLGCRNVSHLLINRTVNINETARNLSLKKTDNSHYLNNYRQRRAILTMSGIPFIDGGFFVLRESPSPGAYMAEITYSYYSTDTEKNDFLKTHENSIQCVMGNGHLAFGTAQTPAFDDWADGTDVIKFLRDL